MLSYSRGASILPEFFFFFVSWTNENYYFSQGGGICGQPELCSRLWFIGTNFSWFSCRSCAALSVWHKAWNTYDLGILWSLYAEQSIGYSELVIRAPTHTSLPLSLGYCRYQSYWDNCCCRGLSTNDPPIVYVNSLAVFIPYIWWQGLFTKSSDITVILFATFSFAAPQHPSCKEPGGVN